MTPTSDPSLPGETEDPWLIVKRDLFYMPGALGYTGIRDHAGRYTHEEAKAHENPEAGVTIIKLSEAPEFSKACFDDLAREHLTKQRDLLEVRIAGLEALLVDAQKEIAELKAKVAVRDDALRPFAEAYRRAKTLGVPDSDDISFPVPDLARAAELVPPKNT